jgi:hypothetical protein
MKTFEAVIAFVLGVYLAMRVIASWYGVIDLWYTLRTVWPKVSARIVIWGGCALALTLLLTGQVRSAFVTGFVGYLAFYLVTNVFTNEIIYRLIARRLRRPAS